jgi:hypothetical protein
MAVTSPRSEKPVSDMGNRALGQHISRERKKLAELGTVELSGPELRAGKGDEHLAEMNAVGASIQAAEAERDRRRAMSVDSGTHGLRLRARREMEQRRKQPNPVASALGKVRAFAHPELLGAKLDTSRISPDEGEELKALILQRWNATADPPVAESLTAAQEKRYERLLGNLAGNERLFGERRKQAAQRTERKDIAEKLRLDGLPRRPVYAEVGSVSLPRFIHSWLKDSRGQFTVADMGLLTALLLMFENQESLFLSGRFEIIDSEPVLILREEQLRFPGSRNNDAMTSGHSGFVREKIALRTLVRNKWFEVERFAGELRIRLGERAKKVRQGS